MTARRPWLLFPGTPSQPRQQGSSQPAGEPSGGAAGTGRLGTSVTSQRPGALQPTSR